MTQNVDFFTPELNSKSTSSKFRFRSLLIRRNFGFDPIPNFGCFLLGRQPRSTSEASQSSFDAAISPGAVQLLLLSSLHGSFVAVVIRQKPRKASRASERALNPFPSFYLYARSLPMPFVRPFHSFVVLFSTCLCTSRCIVYSPHSLN